LKKSSHKSIVAGLLSALVVINAVWAAISQYRGPLFALAVYVLAVYLSRQKGDYRAAFAIGTAGFVFHALELYFHGTAALRPAETVFFYMNLLLPVPLIYSSYKCVRTG